jgi:hypothetical protein
MRSSFRVLVFFPDGEGAEVSECPDASLSERWLKLWEDILAGGGPVVAHMMGSPLSHFEVRMAGPTGQWLAYGRCQFEVAISRGGNTAQDVAALEHFARLYEANCRAVGVTVDDRTLGQIHEMAAVPGVLLFDRVDADCPNEQKAALAQLCFHFTAAFLRYPKKE